MHGNDCLCIIACGKNKRKVKSKASELYIGTSFVVRRDWAKSNFENWCILSAKYGIVFPDDILDPYDVSIKDLSNEQRKRLFEKSLMIIQNNLPSVNHFYLILPAGYAEFSKYLDRIGDVIFPTKGLQGRQILHFLLTGNTKKVDRNKILDKIVLSFEQGRGYQRKDIIQEIRKELPEYSPTYLRRILDASTEGIGDNEIKGKIVFEIHNDLYYLKNSYLGPNPIRVSKHHKLF